MPAINASKGPARTNQCATNMRNLALAAIGHDSSKGSFPAYIQDFGTYQGKGMAPSDPTNRGVPHHKKIGTWAVAILPWIDGQPTYEHWTQDRYPILVADPNSPPALGLVWFSVLPESSATALSVSAHQESATGRTPILIAAQIDCVISLMLLVQMVCHWAVPIIPMIHLYRSFNRLGKHRRV